MNEKNTEYKLKKIDNSVTIDLENLRQKYDNLLVQYKKAVHEYTDYLKTSADMPCAQYDASSVNVDQKCYDYIWKKTGCTTTGFVNANTSYAKSQTLNGLIYDSFLWATMTDSQHREGCYGKSTNYITETVPNYNINQQPFVSIKGYSYTGTGSAGESNATNVNDCIASCANLKNCSGATFVSSKCLVRTGDSSITLSADDSYAIVPKGKQLLMHVDDLNDQLIKVNDQILKKINISGPYNNAINRETKNVNSELIASYESLVNEREKITELMKQYETLEKTSNQNHIKNTKYYYTYILLSILVVVGIAFLYKLNIPIKQSPIQYGGAIQNNLYLVTILILMVIGITKYFYA